MTARAGYSAATGSAFRVLKAWRFSATLRASVCLAWRPDLGLAGDRSCYTTPRGMILCRLQRPVRGGSNTWADHRGRVLGPWPAQTIRAGRVVARPARHRGGATD